MAGSGVVIKNTFLEVGEHASLLDRSEGWRRQMSEPARRFFDDHDASNASGLEELVDYASSESRDQSAQLPAEYDQGLQAPQQQLPASPESGGACGQAPAALEVEDYTAQPAGSGGGQAGSSGVGGGAPAAGHGHRRGAAHGTGPGRQVLLLSESILGQQRRGGGNAAEKDHHAQQRDRRVEARAKDSIINRMKNNDITQREPPWTEVTTVMMRNLPNKYTQVMLLEELLDSGFRIQVDFDFFYLPMDHSNAANLGYCFINFVETAMANAFAAAFQGKKMRRFNSNKTVVVMPASIQGYERNYAYYSSTRVAQAEDPQYRPLFTRQAPVQGGAWTTRGSPAKAAGSAGGRGKGGKGGGKGGKDGGGAGAGPGCGGGCGFGVAEAAGAGPLATSWAAPPQTAAPAPSSLRICGTCNERCSSQHRFCAYCGSFIGNDPQSSQACGAGAGGGQLLGMRPDAHSYVPTMVDGYCPSQAPGREAQHQQHQLFQQPSQVQQHVDPGAQRPHLGANLRRSAETAAPFGGLGHFPPGGCFGGAAASAGSLMADGPCSMQIPGVGLGPVNGPALDSLPTFQYADSITDELDVMRGRMMLLAALKDMETREGDLGVPRGGSGCGGSPQPQFGDQALRGW